MKPIDKALENLKLNSSQTSLTKLQQQTLPKTGLPIHWITELFKVFQSRYFAKWSTAIQGIEERATKEWSLGLSGVTSEQLKHGVDTWAKEWPPSLSEFRNCCLVIEENSKWEHGGDAYKITNNKRIGIVKAKPSTAKTEFSKMKEILGIKS